MTQNIVKILIPDLQLFDVVRSKNKQKLMFFNT